VAAISVRNLTKRFGPVLAVHDLSFDVEPATVTGFLGPNGAGKTTTLRSVLGLVNPTSGSTTVLGRRYVELDDPIRRVGAVLEASGFHPGRTALNHLRVAASAARLPLGRAEAALAQVGLTEAASRKVGAFSLGMRQRLSLAGALLGEPEVLILDEPANGLDPEGIHWLRSFIRAFADNGGTVLVSSHVLSEVAQTVDRVVIVAKGRLVASATLDELVHARAGAIRVRTAQPQRLRDALAAEGVETHLAEPDVVVATGTDSETVGWTAAHERVPIFEMTSDAGNLEDVFLELTGAEGAEAMVDR